MTPPPDQTLSTTPPPAGQDRAPAPPGGRQGSAARFLGLDLGGTNIKGVVVEVPPDGVPRSVATATAPTGAEQGPEGVVAGIIALGRQLSAEHPGALAAGLAVPGLFEPSTGTVEFFTNLPGPWPGFPLGARVAAGLGLPALVLNDGRAFTLAEGRMGAGQGHPTLLGLVLGTGVGGGVLLGGRLHLGRWGNAGEIGHLVVVDDEDAALCGCGARGCVEAYARADVLCAAARRSSAEQVYAGARAGDPACVAAVQAVCGHLAAALVSVVMLLGTDRVVVGGGIAAAGDTLLGPLRASLDRRLHLVPGREVEVVPAVLGSYAGAMGAALAVADAGADSRTG